MVVSIDLREKVAVVTGGGSGIGRATALVLAEAGADIVIPDVNLEGARETAGLVKKLGREALPIKTDVGRSEDVRLMVERAIERCGKVDILVNNAGINTLHRKPFFEQPEDDWKKVLDVDVVGLWLCSKAVAKEMMKGKPGGCIVNIASIAGKVALRLQSNFVAAKAGVIRLTEAMALELAPYHIRVNCVAPGSTSTGAMKSFVSANPEWYDKMMKYVPMGRQAEPREIGLAVLFLASDLAGYITGETLVVDGGWTAGAQIRDI